MLQIRLGELLRGRLFLRFKRFNPKPNTGGDFELRFNCQKIGNWRVECQMRSWKLFDTNIPNLGYPKCTEMVSREYTPMNFWHWIRIFIDICSIDPTWVVKTLVYYIFSFECNSSTWQISIYLSRYYNIDIDDDTGSFWLSSLCIGFIYININITLPNYSSLHLNWSWLNQYDYCQLLHHPSPGAKGQGNVQLQVVLEGELTGQLMMPQKMDSDDIKLYPKPIQIRSDSPRSSGVRGEGR